MPKFYHHSGRLGFAYKARTVGFRRIFPFSLLPYLTGDIIRIHLSVRPLFEENRWQQGILKIEPADYDTIKLGEKTYQYATSDTLFKVKEWSIGRWWSETLSLKSGKHFSQPCNITCSLYFQNSNGDKIETTAPERIADIEVVSRGPFITNIVMWGFTTVIALMAFIRTIIG